MQQTKYLINKAYDLLLFCIYMLVHIQPVEASFHIQKADIPLSNNAVLYIYQDTDGYMWIGTYDGLNLYNGREVITYRHEQNNPLSLCSNIIYKITSGGKDYIWISTTLGLNKFSLRDRVITESYTQYPKLTNIETDEDGNTWMITKDNTITHCINKQGKNERSAFYNIPISNPNITLGDINKMFLYSGNVCILTNDGRLMVKERSDIKATNKFRGKEHNIHDRRIDKAVVHSDALYFVDIQNKLYKYNLVTSKKTFITDLSSFIEGDSGFITQIKIFNSCIYMTFKNSGFIKINEDGSIDSTNKGGKGIPIFCMWPDRYQNLLWIGSDGLGVLQYRETLQQFTQTSLDDLKLINKPIRAILTDSLHNLWIGTNGDGLLKIKDYGSNTNIFETDKLHRFTSNEGLTDNQVFGLERSKSKPIFWIGTERGLSYYSYSDNKIRKVINNTRKRVERIHSIKEINDSTLWVSTTEFGLIKLTLTQKASNLYIKSAETHLLKAGNFICNEIHSMSYDGHQNLTIGSRGGYGVAQFNILNNKYHFMPINQHGEKSAMGDVLCVYESHDSSLYIGSSSGLTQVRHLSGDKLQVKQFDKKNGMINDMIHGILEDSDGYIWLSSNRGLIKYNPRNDSFFNFSSPALSIVEFSDDAFWKCPYTNNLFFGGVNGLVCINPERGIRTEPQKNTKFHFFDIKVSGESFPLSKFINPKTKAIEIPSNISFFAISFIAINFLSDNSYEYSYKLENYNDNWIDLQKVNEVSFINLPYGKYTLKVKYKNDVAEGNEQFKTIDIIKLPPWYLSNTAYLIYTVLIISICGYILSIVKKQLRKKHIQLINDIEKKKKKELLESKINFFTNITHEFFTPLTLIKGICETLRNDKQFTTSGYSSHIETLYNNASDLEKLIKEMLTIRNLEKDETSVCILKDINISKVIIRLLQSYRLIAQRADVNMEENINSNIIWNTDISCFQKIVSNLVSNAFKYTPSGGTVRISVKADDHTLTLEVYNTGKGIEPSKLETIFTRYNILEDVDSNGYSQLTTRTGLGLSICHSMTKLLEGNIEVESSIGEYTVFRVSLPLITPTINISKDSKNNTENSETHLRIVEDSSHYILIVDDNKDIVSMISNYISDSYQVMNAYNAEDALRILEKQNISLIITDIMMPGKDGIELIKEIKQNKFLRYIPLIVISAKITDSQQEEGIVAGADVYLTKPFSISLLKSHINRLLTQKEDIKTYYHSPESAYQYTDGNLLHQDEKSFIDSIISIIDQNIESELLSPDFIADSLHMNSRSLYRKIKNITTLAPMDFIKDYRFLKAERLLITTNLTIQEIMYKVGISNKSYFYREFSKRNNTTPREYRKKK